MGLEPTTLTGANPFKGSRYADSLRPLENVPEVARTDKVSGNAQLTVLWEVPTTGQVRTKPSWDSPQSLC